MIFEKKLNFIKYFKKTKSCFKIIKIFHKKSTFQFFSKSKIFSYWVHLTMNKIQTKQNMFSEKLNMILNF